MEFKILVKAVSSIPHIGQVLAATITIGVRIYEEVKNLDSRFAAEKDLGEEARYIIRDIALYSQNLKASDPVHLERLAKQMKKLKEVAHEIRMHILETSCERQRLIRKYGPVLADLRDCVIETSKVLTLTARLKEAKNQLMEEFQWIRMMEGHGIDTVPPPYSNIEKKLEDDDSGSETSQCIRWVDGKEIDKEPDKFRMMVPVCHQEDSEDGALWYIARVSYFGGMQPGKYKPGVGAYFGHRCEALPATNLDFDVLIAEPDNLRWKPVTGRFSEKCLAQARFVRGCHENDGTELAIARARARKHMRTGIFTEKTLQPGKASPKLDHAYVIAGKKEKKVESYEVLVYADQSHDDDDDDDDDAWVVEWQTVP